MGNYDHPLLKALFKLMYLLYIIKVISLIAQTFKYEKLCVTLNLTMLKT